MKLTHFLSLAFIFGFLGGVLGNYVGDSDILHEAFYVEDSDMINAIEKVEDGVVSVLAFSKGNKKETGGTGFVVDSSGIILTNRHVVQNNDLRYSVVFKNGDEYEANVLSKDPFDDVAVLKIEPVGELHVPSLGDSSRLEVGQRVIAIGNALALYENTVTSGIISAVGRELTAFNDFGFSVENFSGLLQTDASINLGNSGGPLVNMKGEVVAMNVAVAASANGIGFAIPVNDLKPIIRSVKKHGEIVRPVLGVRFIMLSESQAQEIDSKLKQGAIIVSDGSLNGSAVIYGGAAFEAGIREKDVIVSVDGEPLTISNPLQRVIREYEPGDKVALKVLRDGDVLDMFVTLKSNKDLAE